MSPVYVTCPSCKKQKLAIQDYMALVGVELVCPRCESNLRIDSTKPFRISVVPVSETLNADSRPASYG